MSTRFLRLFLSTLVLVLISSGIQAGTYHSGDKKKEKKEKLSGDGPYILYQADGSTRVINVNKKGRITDKTYATLPKDFSFRVTDHEGRYPFDVKLHPLKRPEWQYTRPEKVFVMSDPHGRIFWLFYKLEDEAAKAGGHVSFLLGNHEALVLSNDLRYTKDKYKLLAEKLGVEYPSLFGTNTELGRWLATRNTMQIIGTDLYVHAGLGKLFYDKDLNIPTVNEEMSRALFMSKKERKALSPLTDFLYGNDGPIWYRGLVRKDPKYKPLAQDSLRMMLDRYMIKHIFVGHTIFKDISTFYNGKVIAVNVDNKENRKKKRGRAVLIDNGVYYVVGDDGVQRKL